MKEIRTFEAAIEQSATSLEELGINATSVKARYTDWKTGEHALIPAIKMTVKEA